MPTIVHVITDLAMGGAEQSLLRLVQMHHRSGKYLHRVVSLRGRGVIGANLEAAGAHVHALGLNGASGLPKALVALWRIFRRHPPDVIHCWMYHANLIGSMAAKLSRTKNIWGIRASILDSSMGVARSTTWIRRACASVSGILPDRIVYVAHSARAAHEAIGYEPSKGQVIPNGFALPEALSRVEARALIGVPAHLQIVGSIGRFNAAKDPENFVRAAAIIAAVDAEVMFMMVGKDLRHDNPVLSKWIADANLADRFILLGERSDIHACMSAMDVFCLHSVTEAFPNVLAEAMTAGVPCVATDVGDVAEVLGDGGQVVPPSDPQALADAILKILAMDPIERQLLGGRGRKRIEQNYALTDVADQYAALYNELMAQDSRGVGP